MCRKLETAEEELAKAQVSHDKAWKISPAEETQTAEETLIGEAPKERDSPKPSASNQEERPPAAAPSTSGKLHKFLLLEKSLQLPNCLPSICWTERCLRIRVQSQGQCTFPDFD